MLDEYKIHAFFQAHEDDYKSFDKPTQADRDAIHRRALAAALERRKQYLANARRDRDANFGNRYWLIQVVEETAYIRRLRSWL